MENNIEGKIGDKFNIIEKKGKGGTANVFLVKEIGQTTEYVAKIPLTVNDKGENCYEDNVKYLEKEIKYLTILNELNNPNILNIIDNGEGKIIRYNRNNGEPVIRKYIVLEYAPNRELADYTIYTGEGLGERNSKVLFYKIVKTIQAIHSKGICHRDIKLENILLDDKFNPKIADFGFAAENATNLNEYYGTVPYIPPEFFAKSPYDGFESDVFSLGVLLMTLTFNISPFFLDEDNYKLYKLIEKNLEKEYWAKREPYIINRYGSLSKEFKDLFFHMVVKEPGKRLKIEEILAHNWFKEYKDMTDEEKNKLDDEIKEEFEKREIKIEDRVNEEIEGYNMESVDLNTRGGGDDEDEFFDENSKPCNMPKKIEKNFIINIKKDCIPYRFMNKLCNMINKKYGNDCFIDPHKEKLKMTVYLQESNENGEENFNGNETTIKIKLYQNNQNLLLKFIKLEGTKENFFDKFSTICNLLKNNN